ncbi:YonK family protein [Alkalihalophilus pseudofirmus]|uniref:YonK family protein n=1 Tax=Alkalihalophilus pseudofirmus TaxID=79885 RepID=UPI00259AF4A3|nr:YonK family protein [Alkalihalophilus pseudofirmus]WEG18516.1 YonK family protein [Alkalihalophilus pseudofirmus]
MAKNKETMSTNITGKVNIVEMTATETDKDGNETVYSILDVLRRFDGLETSITFKVDNDIEPIEPIEEV